MPIAASSPRIISRYRRRPKLLDHPLVRLLLLTGIALVLRWPSFGDPNITAEEGFYHAAGLAMHHGALPYVDVWDHNPLGLFLIYWAITGLSPTPLAYQLVACASAVGTAFVIGSIVRRWASGQGALLAGLVYLAWLVPLFGFGGQSPVFSNLLIVIAAALLLHGMPALARRQPSPAVTMALLLAGLAITVKTTALFEALFLGLCAVEALWRSHQPVAVVAAKAFGWALLGAAPTLAISGYYAAVGHWSEYWHAMVTANLVKGGDWATWQLRLEQLWRLLLPVTLAAAGGLILQRSRARPFVIGWLVAALVGLAAVPNIYSDCALPLLMVLCVAAGPLLDRRWIGLIAALIVTTLAQRAEPAFRPGQAEQNASHLDPMAELRRVLAARPDAMMVQETVRNGPAIPKTWPLVNGYVRTNCRRTIERRVEDSLVADDLVVWGDCLAKVATTNFEPDTAGSHG